MTDNDTGYEDTDRGENGFGLLGRFSALGFVVLGLLSLLKAKGVTNWPLSARWSGRLSLLAGVGAVLLYFGNDPTRPEPYPRETEPLERPA